MAFAVSLWFDELTENKIREIWRILHLQGVASKFHLGPYRPHVTLAVCETLDVHAFNKHLSGELAQQSPFEIQFSHVGVFLNDPLVLFLGVVCTGVINEIQGKVLHSLVNFGQGLGPYYRVDHWTPHCSLALPADEAELASALSVCKKQALPSPAFITRIGIIDTPAEVELSYVSLGKAQI